MEEQQENLSFLPLIYDIVKSIEKDSHEVPQKISDLKARFQKGREYIEKLPGIDHNCEEQLQQLEILRKQFTNKTELLQKYKNQCKFELPHQ
ncbi:mediator of RNA polymerase II transcription subunit 9-like [Lineus longissimus]|uniref:mediator of RNA polymerase II transcription subunit 9-like n=1 Tax=Lineus longissimus TaxID=88925 RepID=UPI00315C923B